MNITVTDTALLTPTGGIASNTPIKIVCLEGYDQVLTGAISEFTTDDAGAYSFPLYYGVHAIYVRFDTKFKLLGKVTITSELADTATISDLLLYTEPMLPSEIAFVSNLVYDAKSYAQISSDSADRAEYAAAEASTASDSAVLNSNIYETTTAGLANTSDGEYFSIPSTSGYAYIELYKNDSGMAEYIDAYPNKTYVEDVVDNFQFDGPIGVNGEDVAFAITDESGSSAMIFGLNGEVEHSNMEMFDPVSDTFEYSIADEISSVAFGVTNIGSIVSGGVETSNEYNKDYDYAITDEHGSVALAIDKEGNIISSSNGEDAESWGGRYSAEDMYIEWYGQSLSIGIQGLPALTTTQSYNNKMFASGIRWDDEQVLTSYSPMIEESNEDDGKGETGVVVMSDYLSENDPDYEANGTQYIGSASGLGGQPIASLVKGTIIYGRLTDRLQAGYDLSNSLGRSFNLWQLFWTQGEADYVAETTADEYKEQLIQLQDDISEDAQDITGQDFKVPMIMYQCAAHRKQGYDYPSIAIAQAELGKSEDDMFVSHAMYNFDYFTDDLHLTNDGYVMLGKYYGAAAQELKETGTVSSLNIERVITQGKVVEVQLNVPNGPLVIDTTRVSLTPNYGFDIYTNDVLNDIIDTVEVVGNNIKIKTTIDIPSGSQLRYANGRTGDDNVANRFTGPRGNIRDSRGDTLNWTNSESNTDRADNWLLISVENL